MLIHLEAGTCESGVDVADIDEWAFEDERESLNRWRDALRYRCPVGLNFSADVSFVVAVSVADCLVGMW